MSRGRLSVEDAEKLRQAWESELARKPPTIGVVGVSGVGKSSTINTMFRTDLPISHTVACTKEFTEVPLRVQASSGPGAGDRVQLVVVDAPGLGEDVRRDAHYLDMYERHLPECDVVLWVTAARNRAVALEQQYLQRFSALQDRIVFGVSQVDLVEPRNWKSASLVPSREQEANIEAIIADRGARLSDVVGRQVRIVPYSNYKGYNLEWLFTSLLESCTSGRKWIFEALKNFELEDWIATMPGTRSGDGVPSDSEKSGGRFGRFWQRPPEQARGGGNHEHRGQGNRGGGHGGGNPDMIGLLFEFLREFRDRGRTAASSVRQHNDISRALREVFGHDELIRRNPTEQELDVLERYLKDARIHRNRRDLENDR